MLDARSLASCFRTHSSPSLSLERELSGYVLNRWSSLSAVSLSPRTTLRNEIAQYDRYLESVRYEMHDPPAFDLEVSGAFRYTALPWCGGRQQEGAADPANCALRARRPA
jgi:hypothetical protein